MSFAVLRMFRKSILRLLADMVGQLQPTESSDKDEMQFILNELDGQVCDDKLYYSNCCFTDLDVSIAIT